MGATGNAGQPVLHEIVVNVNSGRLMHDNIDILVRRDGTDAVRVGCTRVTFAAIRRIVAHARKFGLDI